MHIYLTEEYTTFMALEQVKGLVHFLDTVFT